MGTSAGPSLQGIGRGGDSNLVLEMDAHDAKSYPGEPTTNTLLNGYFPGTDTTTVTAGWTLSGTAAITSYRPAAEEFFYKNLGLSNPRVFQINGGGWYNDSGSGFTRVGMPNPTPGFSTSTATTVSFWYRFTGQNAAQLSNQYIWFDFDYGLANLAAINYTDYNDTEWHFFSATQTSSASYAYYNLYIYANLYSNCPGGSYFEIGALQIEQKGYATPFVGDGQFARPASVNLMIHGNVGTGTSFEDSSPSKHTITANGDVTHSGGQSKFGGESIYFDGTGDYLNVADSTDWEFSNGVFTIDFWYKNNSTATSRGVISISNSSVASNYESILVFTAGSGTNLVFYSSSNNTWDIASGAAMGAFGSGWTHYAIVRESVAGDIKLYNNGTLQTTVSTSATLRAVDTFRIGQRVSGSNGASCYLDEIRITKGTALWTSAFTPPTRRNLSAPVVDRSGNDNGGNFNTTDMTDVVTYRVGEVIRPIDSAVWDFDGTDDIISTSFGNGHNPSTSPITYSFWVKQDSVADEMFAVQGNWLVGSQRAYFGSLASYWNMGVEATGWGNTAATRGDAITAGVWVNVVIVFTGTAAKMYNNGIYKYEIAYSSYTFNQNLEIGGETSSSYDWNGKIGAVAVFDKALTDQQIVENFNQQRNRFNI